MGETLSKIRELGKKPAALGSLAVATFLAGGIVSQIAYQKRSVIQQGEIIYHADPPVGGNILSDRLINDGNQRIVVFRSNFPEIFLQASLMCRQGTLIEQTQRIYDEGQDMYKQTSILKAIGHSAECEDNQLTGRGLTEVPQPLPFHGQQAPQTPPSQEHTPATLVTM